MSKEKLNVSINESNNDFIKNTFGSVIAKMEKKDERFTRKTVCNLDSYLDLDEECLDISNEFYDNYIDIKDAKSYKNELEQYFNIDFSNKNE